MRNNKVHFKEEDKENKQANVKKKTRQKKMEKNIEIEHRTRRNEMGGKIEGIRLKKYGSY